MARFYYFNEIESFLHEADTSIFGKLTKNNEFTLEEKQKNAWIEQIDLLKRWLKNVNGYVIFEYSIPRMGRRIDCVILSKGLIFAIEFKVGESTYPSYAIDQVMDYALDLKNFQAQSHNRKIIPILVCTKATERTLSVDFFDDGIAKTILTNGNALAKIITEIGQTYGDVEIDADA